MNKIEQPRKAVSCEICAVIQKLGLRKSTHALWLCTDKQMPRRCRRVAIIGRTTVGLANHLHESEFGESRRRSLRVCRSNHSARNQSAFLIRESDGHVVEIEKK